MSKEIERKFLVTSPAYRRLAVGTPYCQGYIPTLSGMTVRVRIAGERAYLTLKDKAVGCSRNEFEYPIPLADARQMLALMCERPLVEKLRYRIPAAEAGLVWEVDEFLGDNAGLVIAEMEVPDEATVFTLPEWVGREVTGVRRYNNAALVRHPYARWTDEERTEGLTNGGGASGAANSPRSAEE